jgi:hypothetical protein
MSLRDVLNPITASQRIYPSHVCDFASLLCSQPPFLRKCSVASMLTHMLATGWAGFQISHTAQFRKQYLRIINNGACAPLSLLPSYWKERTQAELAILSLNIVAMVISAFLTWKLIKVGFRTILHFRPLLLSMSAFFQLFGWQTFKRMGASLAINRCYKIVLTFSITIQLSMFFMLATVSLWLDQLFNGAIGKMASLMVLYKITSAITLVVRSMLIVQ